MIRNFELFYTRSDKKLGGYEVKMRIYKRIVYSTFVFHSEVANHCRFIWEMMFASHHASTIGFLVENLYPFWVKFVK